MASTGNEKSLPSSNAETTMELLEATLRGVSSSPEKAAVMHVDSDEDEVFFGPPSDREAKNRKAKKLHKLRRTLDPQIRTEEFARNPAAFISILEEDEDENCAGGDGEPADQDKENLADADNINQELELTSMLKEQLAIVKETDKTPTPSPRKIKQHAANEEAPVPKTRTTVAAAAVATQDDSTAGDSGDAASSVTPSKKTPLQQQKRRPMKEIKSASKLLSHLAPEVMRRPALEEDADDDDDDDEEKVTSILDVENDQLFDDSIFTEYDEKNLSQMSHKLSKDWRQQRKSERRKTGNFVEAPSITSLVSDMDSSNGTTRMVPETPSQTSFETAAGAGAGATGFSHGQQQQQPGVTLDEIDGYAQQREESNKRRDSSASTFTDYFNTTREEMILYEKFGENYDEIVAQMSHQEKIRLKEEVAKSTPKSAAELLGQNDSNLSCGDNRQDESPSPTKNISSNASRALDGSLSTTSQSFIPVPIQQYSNSRRRSSSSPRRQTPRLGSTDRDSRSASRDICTQTPPKADKYNDSKYSSKQNMSIFDPPMMSGANDSECDMSKSFQGGRSFGDDVRKRAVGFSAAGAGAASRLPETPQRHQQQQLFSRPMEFRTPSLPRLNIQSEYGATRTMPSYLRPTAASRMKASPNKNPECMAAAASPAPLHDVNPQLRRVGGGGGGGFLAPSAAAAAAGAGGSKLAAKRAMAASCIDMRNIVSPVAQYIKTNPAPPLMRKIRPIKASKYLEEEFDEEAAAAGQHHYQQEQQQPKYFAPLPEGHYYSTRVALEQPVAPHVEHKELPKAFGTVNATQAVVVKHLGRVRVPKTVADLDDLSSPTESGARFKRAPLRESSHHPNEHTMDESTMEMSIREIREIKKPTSKNNI